MSLEGRAPTGPDAGPAVGFMTASVDKYSWRAIGKEDRTGFTGTSILIIGGGVAWNYPSGSPLSRLNQRDSLFFGAGVRLWLGGLADCGPACSLRGASRTLVTWLA